MKKKINSNNNSDTYDKSRRGDHYISLTTVYLHYSATVENKVISEMIKSKKKNGFLFCPTSTRLRNN